jgi:hypothetical protein
MAFAVKHSEKPERDFRLSIDLKSRSFQRAISEAEVVGRAELEKLTRFGSSADKGYPPLKHSSGPNHRCTRATLWNIFVSSSSPNLPPLVSTYLINMLNCLAINPGNAECHSLLRLRNSGTDVSMLHAARF